MSADANGRGIEGETGEVEDGYAEDAEAHQQRQGNAEVLAMVLPVWEPTGDAEVDAALDELTALDDLPSAEHARVFDAIHRRLHGRLSGLASGA